MCSVEFSACYISDVCFVVGLLLSAQANVVRADDGGGTIVWIVVIIIIAVFKIVFWVSWCAYRANRYVLGTIKGQGQFISCLANKNKCFLD